MAVVVRCEGRRYPDGFHLIEREPKEGDFAQPGRPMQRPSGGWCGWLWLTPRNPDRWEPYVLEGTDHRVCLHLANIPTTPEGMPTQQGVVAFANRWGAFGAHRARARGPTGDEQLEIIATTVNQFRKAIGYAADRTPGPDLDDWVQEHCQTQLTLRRGKLSGDAESQCFFQARSLTDFCLAEFLQLLEADVEFKRCPRCSKLLAGGKVGKTSNLLLQCLPDGHVPQKNEGSGCI